MILPCLPMLATAAEPFDSDQHLFEVKWDGVRALAAVDDGAWRLWSRARSDYAARYPELAVLRNLPGGTVVDGEVVQFRDGRAELPALLRRHHLRHPERIRHASSAAPVCYLLFDLLVQAGRSFLAEPLVQRRAALAKLLAKVNDPRLLFSEGVVGPGRALFDHVVAQGHEGIMAKDLRSRYRPGQRSPAWRKIKPTSVLVASVHAGALRYVAQLTRGLALSVKADLVRRLGQRRRLRPVVVCPHTAQWVEPEVYCQVRFFGWTKHGHLRDAVFRGLLSPA